MKQIGAKGRADKSHGGKTRSIQKELLLVLVPAIFISMIVLSLLGYNAASSIIQNRISREMELNLSTGVEKIEKSLTNSGKVSEALAKTTEAGAKVMTLSEYRKFLPSIVATNGETFGGGIWFEPYAHSASEQSLSYYCMRENGKVTFKDNYSLGEGVSYRDQDWYKNAESSKGKTVWSAPYYDDFAKAAMVTSSSPFYGDGGKLMGVATADIDLSELQKMVIGLKANSGDKVFLVDRSGTYIADEDSSKLLKSNVAKEENASLASLGKTALAGASGSAGFEQNGQGYRAWYASVPECGWKLVIASPESQLFAEANALRRNLFLLDPRRALLYPPRHRPAAGAAVRRDASRRFGRSGGGDGCGRREQRNRRSPPFHAGHHGEAASVCRIYRRDVRRAEPDFGKRSGFPAEASV